MYGAYVQFLHFMKNNHILKSLSVDLYFKEIKSINAGRTFFENIRTFTSKGQKIHGFYIENNFCISTNACTFSSNFESNLAVKVQSQSTNILAVGLPQMASFLQNCLIFIW